MNLTKFLKGSAILLLFSSFVISCHDNDVIEKEEDNQDPDTEESINLALGKTVETRINSITGSGSNTEKANLMTDGDLTTYWESADSYKHSILIDLGSVQEVSKIVVHWIDERGCNAYSLNFGKEKDKIVSVISRNDVEEKAGSTFDGFKEEARYVELVLRGRLGYTGGYRISEIEIYNEDNIEYTNTPEEQKALDTITERLIASYLSDIPDDKNIESFSKSMQADGSWTDIDYNDQISADGWKPNGHLNRLKAMALNYKHPESKFFNNATLLQQIEKGLLCFKKKAPSCSDNWWYNDIGAPQAYMIPLLLLKGHISHENMLVAAAYLKDKIESYIGGGKNLSWIAEIAMHKGCAEDNYSTVQHAFKAIASTLSIVSEQGKEGIKIDGSFHQHHAQIYSGGYGMSLTDDVSKFMEMSVDTQFANEFTLEKKEIFQKLLLEGHLLLSFRNSIDFGTRGRNISRPTSEYTTVPVDVLERAVVGDPANAGIYRAWINHINSGTAFPKANVNKHFWKSDMMTQHGENFYMSAKIISKRTYGTESLNNENIKGYNLPLGATNIMTTGKEYDNIYPVWDWTRIPGTTAIGNQDKTSLEGYQIGNNEFGGGVSDGVNGIIAYKGKYNELQANKAYFFFDNMMFCIGSDISYVQNDNVLTSVEQNLLNGEVIYNDGQEKQLSSNSNMQLKQLKWVYHNNTGYIFRGTDNVTIQNMSQAGSWKDINATGESGLIGKNVFSVWINHGLNPENASYQYIVVPDKSINAFRDLAEQIDFYIAQNDGSVQAIREGNKYGFVFYKSASTKMDDGLVISSDKPSIVFIEKKGNTYTIAVSDPTYTQANVTLTLNKKMIEKSGVTITEQGSNIIFTLPVGDYVGSSVVDVFTEK